MLKIITATDDYYSNGIELIPLNSVAYQNYVTNQDTVEREDLLNEFEKLYQDNISKHINIGLLFALFMIIIITLKLIAD